MSIPPNTPDRRPLKQRLLDHYVEEAADQWIFEPHPALDWNTPATVVDRGDQEVVHQLIDRMNNGEFL